MEAHQVEYLRYDTRNVLMRCGVTTLVYWIYVSFDFSFALFIEIILFYIIVISSAVQNINYLEIFSFSGIWLNKDGKR